MSEIKDTRAYSINDFINWYEKNEMQLSPKYQRNAVWNHNAKSYLIDTIIRGYPIPQVFLRQTIDTNTRKTTREIIDGQQRLRSIIEFIGNRFPIQKSHNLEFGGKFYDNLDEQTKENILNFSISVEIIKIKDDARIYEMFARLNTNNMALNKQELRNAEFWGEFKVFVYRKSAEFKEFFIVYKIFKDNELSRMMDVEFFNSLIIHLIDGITTETATKIDNYYKKYDKEFPISDEIEFRLNRIMEVFITVFENSLFQTKLFHRKSYLFTIFCVLNHQLFDSLGNDIPRNDKFLNASMDKNIEIMISKLMEFEAELTQTLSEKEFLDENAIKNFILFEKLHKTRTTNEKERKDRIKILSSYLSE